MTERLRLFVACAPGLEELLAEELGELGVEEAAVTDGGVGCFGDVETVYRINLGCGLGLRVLVRMAEFFARDFAKLERVAKTLPWDEWLVPGRGVRVRAHSKRSRLYHQKAIVERIERGIERKMGGAVRARSDEARGPGGGELGEGAREPILVQVRFVRDRCTISIDTTGTLLHKRGWREQTAKAPLREDLARALLRVSGWRPGMALFDPAAGSGTLAIEAATMAAGLAPGANRSFSCMLQPGFGPERFDAIRSELTREAVVGGALIGADRDAGAVAAAQANAVRAGMGERVRFVERALGDDDLPDFEFGSEAGPSEGELALVANLPWGRRTGDPTRLRNLYASFGKLALRLPRPLNVGLVTTESALAGATKLGLERRVLSDQGGVKIGFWVKRLV